jgi:hypothetical protein
MVRRLVDDQRGDEHDARPAGMHGIDRRRQVGHGGGAAFRQIVELELVGCDEVRDRQHALLDELGNAAANEDAAVDVADHGIAAVARRRIGALHPRDRVDHRRAGIGRAEIAGDHAVAFAQHAAFGDALDHHPRARTAEHAAAPAAVAGVIGELHRLHRPDLDPDAL